MTALNPDISALWREAGSRIAAAGLPPEMPHCAEMIVVAGAYAAAQAQAYAAESDLHRHLGWELLTGGSLEAWAELDTAELMTVKMVVARTWRAIAVEVGRLRAELGEAA